MSSECISLAVAIVSAFVAIVTLIATITIGKMQINQNLRMDKRDEQRYNDAIYSAATKFILKYSASGPASEICLLPLCVMAYKYNPIYPYHREMYREFCSLTEEVQNCILEREKIELQSSKANISFKNLLNFLRVKIADNYPDDDDLYYNDGKYWERALLNHGSTQIPEIQCLDHNDTETNDTSHSWAMELAKGCKSDYEEFITELLAEHQQESPIKQLMHTRTNLGIPVEDGEILISYLACMIAKYVPIYTQVGSFECISSGFEEFHGIVYMEDLFLDSLFSVYHQQMYSNQPG